MNLQVIALESSGRRWVDRILAAHPELSVTGNSFPSDGGEHRRYPQIELSDALCVVCRDLTVQFKSVEQLKYNLSTADRFSTADSLQAVGKVIADFQNHNRLIVWISYETLLAYRETYLRHIFTSLGVDRNNYDYSAIDYVDGNLKYLK